MDIADLWVVLTILGFFGLCVALVYGCDRIIGPDDEFLETSGEDQDEDQLVTSDGAR